MTLERNVRSSAGISGAVSGKRFGNTGPKKFVNTSFDKLSDRPVQFCEALGRSDEIVRTLIKINDIGARSSPCQLDHAASENVGACQAIEFAIRIIINAAGMIFWMPWAGLLLAFRPDPFLLRHANNHICFLRN